MTATQKRRFRMLCRELAALLKEVRREGELGALYVLEDGVLHFDGHLGRVLEAEKINP